MKLKLKITQNYFFNYIFIIIILSNLNYIDILYF